MIDTKHPDRSTYIGSHDIAAIMGEHPFLSKMEVFMRKTGQMDEFETTEQMRWGLINERNIIDEYREKKSVRSHVEYQVFKRHDAHSWMGGTADVIIHGEPMTGVDAKNVRFKGHEWGEPGTDQVPRYVLWQAHHFMTLFDYQKWDICPLFSGCQHEIFTVLRDHEISKMLLEIGHEFWENHIVKGVAPDIDETEASRNYLKKKYPNHDDTIRQATSEEAQLMQNLADALDFKKQTETDISLMKNNLQDMIGESKGLESTYGTVTWKTQAGARRIDTTRFKKDYPALAEEYTKQANDHRVMRTKFDKERL